MSVGPRTRPRAPEAIVLCQDTCRGTGGRDMEVIGTNLKLATKRLMYGEQKTSRTVSGSRSVGTEYGGVHVWTVKNGINV